MCNPTAITASKCQNYQSILLHNQNTGQQIQQEQNQQRDDPATLPTVPTDITTTTTTTTINTNIHNNNHHNNNNRNPLILPLNLPIVIGPLRFITTLQSSRPDFIPPPYLVAEIDDGVETSSIEEHEIMHHETSHHGHEEHKEEGEEVEGSQQQQQQQQHRRRLQRLRQWNTRIRQEKRILRFYHWKFSNLIQHYDDGDTVDNTHEDAGSNITYDGNVDDNRIVCKILRILHELFHQEKVPLLIIFIVLISTTIIKRCMEYSL
jgi:hypothetical protein